MAIPLTIVLDVSNRYNNRLYWGNRLIAQGNAGLEGVEIRSGAGGKKSTATVTLSEFQVFLLEGGCPEEYRYAKVQRSLGNREALSALQPVCEMLLINVNACDGCPMRPRQFRAHNSNAHAETRMLDTGERHHGERETDH